MEDCHHVIERIMLLYEKYQYQLGLWLAFDRDTHEFMGWFLFRPDKKEPDNTNVVELGYRFKRKFWGKGLATEGGKAFIDYGFKHLGVEKIFAIAMKSNLKSQAVMKKLGMSYEYDYIETQLPPGLQEAVYFSLKSV
jgi:RimJ/RimL family protein N-acetyltransferase